MHTRVLLRHGESIWNKENRFTGWTDVELSDRGREEAREAGRLLKEGGYVFDIAFASVLKRAIDDELRPLRHFHLGDPEKVAAAAARVASQAKA